MAETKKAILTRERQTADRQRAALAEKETRKRAAEHLTALIDSGMRPDEAHRRVFDRFGVKLRGYSAAQDFYRDKTAFYRQANKTLISTRISKTDVDRLNRACAAASKVLGRTVVRSELARLAIAFMLDDMKGNAKPWLNDLAAM